MSLNFEGLGRLESKLKISAKAAPRVKRVVMKSGADLSNRTQELMNERYKGHWENTGKKRKWIYSTGTTRRSAVVHITDDSLTAYVAPQTAYFPYLEYGTRYMSARPTLGPAFHEIEPKFKRELKQAIKGKD